jgi:hypothetical protein
MITSQNKEIQALVNDIRDGKLLLPELQRRFVWKSTQVRDLFDSLYHQYPSGQILVWETNDLPYSHAVSLDQLDEKSKWPLLLLDGQQRLTSLAAIMLGKELIVRNSKHPIDVAFNVYTEKFEVAGRRQSKEAGWISLSELYTQSVLKIIIDLKLDMNSPESNIIYERLKHLENVKTYTYQVNILENMSYEEVTHIFVRINSGGTKLGTADLALAQMSSRWRGVTQEMSDLQDRLLKNHKFELDNGITVRALSALLSGQTRPAYMFRGERQKITVIELKEAWGRLVAALDVAILFLINNCEIDKLDLLPTQYILIPLIAFFDRYKENITEKQSRDLQRWVYLALMWMRYSGATETAADQDIAAMNSENPIQQMIQNIEDKVGKGRPITERELQDQRRNSPFMLMSYVIAQKASAVDWFTGVRIHGNQALELHHIFPKDVLREKYDLKAESRTIDQVANLAFLSKKANVKIKSQSPAQYLPSIPETRLYSQQVPQQKEYWTLERFEDFLRERRSLIANSINLLLQSLSNDPTSYKWSGLDILETRIDTIEGQLRELVTSRLIEYNKDRAFEMLPKELQQTIYSRVNKYLEENPYKANEYSTFDKKLEFCQFSDYEKIIQLNWHLFVEVFGQKENFSKHIKQVTNARNAFKHNRDISKADLAMAEAGLIWLEECLMYASMLEEENNSENEEEE